jgi:hypothetical protein
VAPKDATVAIDIVKEGAGGICIVASRQKILDEEGLFIFTA